MSKLGSRLCLGVLLMLGVMLCTAAEGLAQPVLDSLSSEGPFHYQATLQAQGRVVVDGDVALLAGTGLVRVFERDPGPTTGARRPSSRRATAMPVSGAP
jgi:hypothetical protein